MQIKMNTFYGIHKCKNDAKCIKMLNDIMVQGIFTNIDMGHTDNTDSHLCTYSPQFNIYISDFHF